MLKVDIEHGDITGDTDLPIQAAIDYLSYIGGGTVKIGEGIYTINNTIHLRSNISIEGIAGKTVLRKCDNEISCLSTDADEHEEQITLQNIGGFHPGQTVTVRESGKNHGFGVTVAVITGMSGNVLYLDRKLYRSYLKSENAVVERNFPVISGYDCEDICLKNIVIEGNRENNSWLDGCRNAGIYFFQARNIEIDSCCVHNYNGDGISYQDCFDVTLKNCRCTGNGGKGIHPGSGTEQTVIIGCETTDNNLDGIFLCYRVRNSLVENCLSSGNGMSGLSIGHKDTHNIIRNNQFLDNHYYGIFFRNEPESMGADYNLVEGNLIKDNGCYTENDKMGYVGIRIRGFTNHVKFVGNRIVFENAPLNMTIGICTEKDTHDNVFENNEFVQCTKEFHTHWLL